MVVIPLFSAHTVQLNMQPASFAPVLPSFHFFSSAESPPSELPDAQKRLCLPAGQKGKQEDRVLLVGYPGIRR